MQTPAHVFKSSGVKQRTDQRVDVLDCVLHWFQTATYMATSQGTPPSFGPVLHVLQRVQHTTVYISAAKISSGPESGQKRQVQDALKAAMPTIRPPVIIEYFARRTMTTSTFSPQQWHSTRSEWPGVVRNHFKCSPKRATHFLCLQQGKFRRNNAPSRTFAAKIFCPPPHQLSTCVSRRPR